jgi:hypothetical protein
MYKKDAITMFKKFGFNVLPLRGKRPIIEWDKWKSEAQTLDDIEAMPWHNATGIGVIMGKDDLGLFDIDGIEDYDLLDSLYEKLGLTEKYPWVVQSGSGEGFHIYFRCKEYDKLAERFGGKGVYKFKLKKDGVCKHIELRLRNCQTAFPPSMHESSGVYTYYYGEPTELPVYLDAETVFKCLEDLCVVNEPASEKTKSPSKQYIDTEKLESALNYLSENLPEGCYDEWYRIGFGLVPFGVKGEDYFVEMSLNNPHYKDTEESIREKFAGLVKDYDGRISVGSIYHIAESYGWKKPVIKFWSVEKPGIVKIVRPRFKRFLESEGYCKYKIDDKYLYVKITNNIVEEFESIGVKDFVISYLYELPMEEFGDCNRSEVMDALMKGANQFFTNQFLEFLITRNIEFNRDTGESSFIYFQNGYVEVTKDEIRFQEYKHLKRHIWKRQILNRNYFEETSRSDFEEFLHNVCGKDTNRLNALRSAIGYALHCYKDPSVAKAIIFMDERLSDGAFGRSGKGLLIKAISQIRNIVVEDGRNFNPSKNFAFQRVKADTNIIAFEDLREKYPFERLYSIITEGITIEKKNRDEIFIPFNDSPKILISTNFSIRGVDDSTVDRQFIIEFTDHYSSKHRPVDEFGKLFYNPWSEEEWNQFDNLMFECLQLYLKKGLIEYEHVNLDQKRLIDETCEEFAEFSDDIELNHEHNKKAIYGKFIAEYDEYEKLTQGKFTRWLKIWAKLKNFDVVEGKSGANRTIIFNTLKQAA